MNLYGNGLVSTGGETLLYDGLGAVRQTTGSGSPAVQWSGSYQGYGMTSSSSGSTGNPYRWGAESGYRSDGFGPTYAAPLQKVGARYYDPEFGCFLTRDTELGQKPYVYCDSDPINFSDPSGHQGAVDPTRNLPPPRSPSSAQSFPTSRNNQPAGGLIPITRGSALHVVGNIAAGMVGGAIGFGMCGPVGGVLGFAAGVAAAEAYQRRANGEGYNRMFHTME